MQTPNRSVTAISHPNIAFIKYWGNCEAEARIPANGSISMNLGGLETRTTVTFDSSLQADKFILNNQPTDGIPLRRVSDFLDGVRLRAKTEYRARVISENNFPMGAGIASSASAFAALALAASRAAGLDLNEAALSRLARTGSGSACRSIPGGFTEWQVDACEPDSGAFSIADPDHWDLRDCIAIISREHKAIGSTEGHALAYTSPIQVARVDDSPRRLDLCRQAILQRDFGAFADVTELDTSLMHAVMLTSRPSLIYWQPPTLTVMQAVQEWRKKGIAACFTIDAGPNVHVITTREDQDTVVSQLRQLPGVIDVLSSFPGGPARLV